PGGAPGPGLDLHQRVRRPPGGELGAGAGDGGHLYQAAADGGGPPGMTGTAPGAELAPEEAALYRRARAGDGKARQQLALRHLPLVREIAGRFRRGGIDRKSTRLNSSHVKTSYAVFCLKKKR